MNSNDISQIITGLYISNWSTSNNINVLQDKNIRAVISIETEPKPDYIIYYYKTHGIDFMYINLYDSPNADISKYFDVTFNFIKNHLARGENVLVHCMAGISRSATIVLNYIIKNVYEKGHVQKDPRNIVEDVIKFVQSRRSIINPNYGFQQQLVTKATQYSKNPSTFWIGIF
jgi:protein-tyrosine phosphatase